MLSQYEIKKKDRFRAEIAKKTAAYELKFGKIKTEPIGKKAPFKPAFKSTGLAMSKKRSYEKDNPRSLEPLAKLLSK